MREFFIKKNLDLVKKYYNYDSVKLNEIRYGLESLYITITKTIVICILAYLLNIFKEFIYLFLLYGLLRSFAHGLHTKTSLQCWIYSIVTFILFPYLIRISTFDIYFKILISIATFVLLSKYSPADTEKKPIINKKKRVIFKIITILISLTYIIFILFSKDIILINSLIYSLILETMLVLPMNYKILNIKYDNYKEYLKRKIA